MPRLECFAYCDGFFNIISPYLSPDLILSDTLKMENMLSST